MSTNNENFEDMFPDFGDVFEEELVENQQIKYLEQIMQDEKKNLNYLNLSVNHMLPGMKNHQENPAKQFNDSKEILNKQKQDDQEIKKLKKENVKLHQTLEEMNKEISELKNLVYDNMLVLGNHEEIQNLNNEITKLNQVVEESSTEFLDLKKLLNRQKK
ncbi:uncharacterized protein LOC136088214 [Hydra vulgaris]|uniref:Uncharacterized protein LOC136088214 n=1 Tax=Hydra vulgaris TaxID=6087 RepID=A0ABM4D160_HYDVU